jgi:hypothetical protein
VPIVALVVISWVLMQPQQTGTLVPILLHFIGVMLLCALAIVITMRRTESAIQLTQPSTSVGASL